MMSIRRLIVFLVACCSLIFNGWVIAQSESGATGTAAQSDSEKPEGQSTQPTRFLRISKDQVGNAKALQTSITRYQDDERGLLIDLIGVVHIGEADYYRKLNHQFTQYESVLYELVAPQGTRVPAGGQSSSGNPIAWLQQSAQHVLGLKSQLAIIDYQRDNFVHADLSPSQMSEKMAQRGENVFTVGLNAMAEMMRKQNIAAKELAATESSGDVQNMENMLEMLGNPLVLKRMMADQFTQNGELDAGLGKTLNRILITDRNAAAMKVLHQEIEAGKKRLAVFYGAAHMPDFDRRLKHELGLKQTRHVWVDAWDLTRAPNDNFSSPLSAMMKLLQELED